MVIQQLGKYFYKIITTNLHSSHNVNQDCNKHSGKLLEVLLTKNHPTREGEMGWFEILICNERR